MLDQHSTREYNRPVLRFTSAVGLSFAAAFGIQAQKPTLRCEWLYPVESRIAWQQARATGRQLALRIEREQDADQVMVADWQPDVFRPAFPFEPADGLESVQFHVYVTPRLDPARIAIGAVVRMRARQGYESETATYSYEPAIAWFQHELTRRIGASPEEVSDIPMRLRAQILRLWPSATADRCDEYAGLVVDRYDGPNAGVTAPRLISEVRPTVPTMRRDYREAVSVALMAEVTEHGTLVNLHLLEPPWAADPYKIAAMGAAALWRFTPARIGSCAVASTMRVEISFRAE